MVPPNHEVLNLRDLEAEAMGLLDRMLTVLQDNSRWGFPDDATAEQRERLPCPAPSDALLVDATINTLSILIRTRPGTSGRIVNAVLNFNPMKLANTPLTPRAKVLVKSMEKTTRMLLIHLMKRYAHGSPPSGRKHPPDQEDPG